MICRKLVGMFAKYLPLIGILILYLFSLYRGATTIVDKMEYSIHIWADILIISAIIGEIGSLLVIERFNILFTGKTPNPVQDIWEGNSQDVAVMYNGMIASSFFVSAIFALNLIYMTTDNPLFLNVAVSIATLWGVGTVIYVFAGYLKIQFTYQQSVFSKLSNPVFLSAIICMIQILVTRKNWVEDIYCSICNPTNYIFRTLALIIVLCYFLSIAFCHFSNIYCLIGFGFIKRDLGKIQRRIDCLQEKEEKRETILRQATKDIDEAAERFNLIKRVGLIIPFYFVHIKIYILGRFCAVSYLLSLLDFKITKIFSTLLEPERIRINGIRFCLVTAVLELLSLDFILFIYLEGDDPCLKFFELLSTVIIIPILLSCLAELKSKVDQRNGSETNM